MELVLNTYGVSLHRDNENFVICNSEGKQKIPAEGIKSIQVSRGAQVTSDAVVLADLSVATYNQMRNDLTEVQASYDNNDSILIVPISTDYLNSMKVIGKNINTDIILKTRNPLFF